LILALEEHAVLNAVTSINNSLMQTEIWCYMFKIAFLGAFLYTSGLARVPCALGQEIFLRPPSTKTTKFEVKNSCKSAEEAKIEHLL